MNERPHEGHHDCYHELASRMTAEQFVELLDDHPELHDLFLLTGGPPIIVVQEEE